MYGLLSAKDGTTLWKQDTLLYRNLTVPVFWHDYIIVGDKEGYLHILSVKEGKLVGREKIGGDGIVVSPIVVDDVLYVSTSDGKVNRLYALNVILDEQHSLRRCV